MGTIIYDRGCEQQSDMCCCKCVYRKKDFNHPEITKRSITTQRGWACANPELGGIISDWPEHSGGCECHTTLKDIKQSRTS